mmetsp:Transcript_38658/g.95621  ORF Transcript_38658/g.95621 Transcript_38658/m.95621 type:complete len:112 (+) Transcript_38658:1616-1951(+)
MVARLGDLEPALLLQQHRDLRVVHIISAPLTTMNHFHGCSSDDKRRMAAELGANNIRALFSDESILSFNSSTEENRHFAPRSFAPGRARALRARAPAPAQARPYGSARARR